MTYLEQNGRFSVDINNPMSHYRDLVGETFGYVTVMKKLSVVPNLGHAFWLCRCVCGNFIKESSKNLRRSNQKSCGCKKIIRSHKDYTGQVFGKLTVIERTEQQNEQGAHYWECRCACGGTKLVIPGSLESGGVLSCGCLQPTKGNKTLQRIKKIWHGMIDRCHNPSRNGFKGYGAKGIFVCEEWRNNFYNFADWAIENGYKSGLTIDRFPNKNGNYEPSNCRWATVVQQANNTISNRIITICGISNTVAEWSRITKVPGALIVQRIDRLGWGEDDAVTTLPGVGISERRILKMKQCH